MYKNDYLEISNEDNMELMARYPDKHFDLAVVDPEYGIGISKNSFRQKHDKKDWDAKPPNNSYFNELFRVSINQIIWGGNYFELPPSQGFFIWDKKQPFDFSSAMCEYAWSSMQKPAKIFNKHVVTAEKNKIHPTQKPVALYEWLFKNYAKEGQKILDTHLGSGSIAIALHNMNERDGMDLTLTACELDKDYYDASIKRILQHTAQKTIFSI